MDEHASNEQLARARVSSERRVGRHDRRRDMTQPRAREEFGNPGRERTELNSNAREHVKPRLPLSDDRSWGVQEVAYFLNVSESTIRNLERDGELPALPRIGTRIIFDPKVVRAFRDGWRPPPRGRAPGRSGISVRSDPRVQR